MRSAQSGPDGTPSERMDTLRTGLKILSGSRLFADLPPDAMKTLASSMKPRFAAPGEVIFVRSDEGSTLFGILVGQVRIVIGGVDGREQVLRVLRPGEMFGEISALDGRSRSADAIAITRCRLLVLERRSLLALIGSNPAVAVRLIEILCERLRDTTAQIEGLLFHTLSERLAAALLSLHRDKMSIDVTQTQLGQLTGVTRESVNKKLRAWQADGLVALQPGRVHIIDAEGLKRLLHPSVRVMMMQSPEGPLRREAIGPTSSDYGPMKTRTLFTAADAEKERG